MSMYHDLKEERHLFRGGDTDTTGLCSCGKTYVEDIHIKESIRERLERIKRKAHGPDVAWLIQQLEQRI